MERTFRSTFITLYEEINQLTKLPNLGKSGPELLRENRAAMDLYDTFKKQEREQDKPSRM